MPKQSQKKSQSQSQSRSRSQSKNGGRGRKKRTMKKDRRVKKSRKVMRGGAIYTEVSKLNTLFQGKDDLKQKLFQATNTEKFEDIMKLNNDSFNTSMIAFDIEKKRGKANPEYAELITLLRSAV